MKKFKLIALTALLAMGTNAFAATTKYAQDANGVRYSYDADEDISTSKAYSATVVGITVAGTSVTIPATFSATNEDNVTTNFKVVGFAANWDKAVAKGTAPATTIAHVAATAITSLTVDATNFSTTLADAFDNAYTNQTALTTLTISSTNDAHTTSVLVTSDLTAAVLKTLTTLDISGCTKMTNINDGAFKVSSSSNIKLTSVTLPASITKIGESAFEGFKGTSFTIPAKVEEIGEKAFAASALTTVEVPATVTTLGDAAFSSSAIASVSGMAGLTAIPAQAFQSCEKLASISLHDKIVEIGANAFDGCVALASVEILGKIADDKLGAAAFKDCEALTSIDLSGTLLTEISDQFSGCKALAEISLPKTIDDIKKGAFAGTVLKTLDLSKTAITWLSAIFGQITDAKNAYSTLTSISLPEGLIGITDYSASSYGVFNYCTGLTEITLPASMTANIPSMAFYYATGLKTLNYQPTADNVVEINDMAFLGCTPLVQINTNKYYFANATNGYEPPLNAKFFDDGSLSVKTVADKGTSGKFFAKYCPVQPVQILPADVTAAGAKIYSVYEDEGTAYFQALKVRSGYLNIDAYQHVIIKSDAEATITFSVPAVPFTNLSIDEDAILSINNEEDVPLATYQTTNLVDTDDDDIPDATYPSQGYKYLYLLTNSASNGGFGFTSFTGTTLKKGNFFLPTVNAPAGGRMNIVWLDEDGNVEGDATAIETVKATAENSALFNLAGQQVDGNYKGIVVKNGKKVILK